MVKCEEFYEKFRQLDAMSKEIKGYCKVDARESIYRFKQYSKFCDKHALPLGNIPEKTLRPLIVKRNENIAPIVVKQLKKRMKSDNPNFARITRNVVMSEIAKVRDNGNSNPLPEGKFNIIYADPPWSYYKRLRGSPEKHYQTLPTEEICALQVPSAEDAILFLWATNPLLEDALEVMKAWGFSYKTNFVWVKDRMGTGTYVRGQHELLLIGVKGKVYPPLEQNRQSSVILASRTKHSEKPEAFYEIIETMYPQGKYLELFARQKRKGWISWGNEV